MDITAACGLFGVVPLEQETESQRRDGVCVRRRGGSSVWNFIRAVPAHLVALGCTWEARCQALTRTRTQVCVGDPEGKVHGLLFPSQEQEFALKMLFVSQGLIS